MTPILDYATHPGFNLLVSPQNAGRYALAQPHHYAQGDHQGNLLHYDTVIAISSDGLAHDISNGFAEHEDPPAWFATLPVPTGWGNRYCLSLLGPKVTAYSRTFYHSF